jgi:nitrate reductase NapD
MNICGVLIHAQPDRGGDVAAAIECLDGAELHQRVPDGRMVVTVEDTEKSSAGDTVLALHRLPGVLSAALVYHHFEPEETIESTAIESGE